MARVTPRLALGFLAATACALAQEPAAGVPSKSFPFEQAGRQVTVWYHVPSGATPRTPVVVVMHGVLRNGETYLKDWTPLSEKGHFLLLVPEFSQKEFPKDEGYIYGNTVDRDGNPVPREQWSFSMIEPIFDAAKARLGNVSPTYSIYGHSAGAQFVQRFLYFVPNARIAHAVGANAGWYMLPDLGTAFPYGLKGTPVTEADLRLALARPYTVLLGTADTNSKDRVLRHTPEADAQGPYRLARGEFFCAKAQAAAQAMGVPFGWKLDFAPGIGHSDAGMAPFALKWLLAP